MCIMYTHAHTHVGGHSLNHVYYRAHVRNIFSHLSSSVSFRVTRWYDGDGYGFFGPTSSTRDQLFEETNEEKKSVIHISLLSHVLNVQKRTKQLKNLYYM